MKEKDKVKKDKVKKGDNLFEEKKDLAPITPKALSNTITNTPAPGTDEITSEDTTFPRWRLLQKTSIEVEEGTGKLGVIKHSLSETEFEKIEIIPICLIKTRVMFNPEDRKGAPICRSVDTKHGSGCTCGCDNVCTNCIYQKWDQGTPPICSLVYNYPCLSLNQIGKEAMPTLLSFMKSSTQSALKINTVVKSTLNPFWFNIWEISTIAKKFKMGTAFVFNAKPLRETTEEERKWVESVYYNVVAGRKIEIDEYEPEGV